MLPSSRKEDGTLRILLIGRISNWKGHIFTLNTFKKYLDEPQWVELTVVGNTYYGYEYLLDDLKRIADTCRFQVNFYSFAADPSIYFMYCDVIVVPSTSPEPFGRVAIEAFSYGKPVIAANHGGITEIVTHNQTGYLFEPNNMRSFADNILKFIKKNTRERQEMSKNARKRFENFFTEDKYLYNISNILLNNNDNAQSE